MYSNVPLEKGTATHSRILAGRIPRTEEPGRLQFIVSQEVVHDLKTNAFTCRTHLFFKTQFKTQ